jgi:NAD-dependent SIR2 family protein deacetylase
MVVGTFSKRPSYTGWTAWNIARPRDTGCRTRRGFVAGDRSRCGRMALDRMAGTCSISGMDEEQVRRAAEIIRWSQTLVVTASAGMSADSGLADILRDQGLWKTYPLYERLGLRILDLANPSHFAKSPEFAWGFFGHRLGLARATPPHAGYEILRRWADRLAKAVTVLTVNVDGQFLKAGFGREAVTELYGSIHHLQCLTPCCDFVWENHEEVPVDPHTLLASRWPVCPACGAVARPNVRMFGDTTWIPARSDRQRKRLEAFLDERAGPGVVVLMLGGSDSVEAVQHLAGELRLRGATIVCINPLGSRFPPPHVSLTRRALAGLTAIDAALRD